MLQVTLIAESNGRNKKESFSHDTLAIQGKVAWGGKINGGC